MEKYQQELFNKLAAYNNNDIKLTMAMGRQAGKSLYGLLMDHAPFVVLEDHWEWPNHKRVDVILPIANWIEQQDITQWKPDTNCARYDRYIITPELLTLLQLKFS